MRARSVFRWFARLVRVLAAIASVAVLTAIDYKVLHVNSATAALTYLLLVLGVATGLGLLESITASLGSVFCYNYFFLPPVGTLTIRDPQNWLALVVFLITAVTASHLSARARRTTEQARMGQHEMERLYDFSRALMIGNEERTIESQVVQQIAQVFGVESASFYDAAENRVYATGSPPIPEEMLRTIAQSHRVEPLTDSSTRVALVQLGGRYFGSLGVSGEALSDAALQAIAQLSAIAIERGREQKAAAHAEAERESEQLKSALLDALAHEFKTPLTSIKAAGTTMLARTATSSIDRELLTVINEETDRMTNMVSEAIELARLPGAELKLQPEPVSALALVSESLELLRSVKDRRSIETQIPEDLPPLLVDRTRSELIFRQLLDNAIKYANPLSSIRIAAKPLKNAIEFEIASEGQAIPQGEQDLIFRKFYRGAGVRHRIPGTGMGLPIARAIVEAHGGEMRVRSTPEGKTSFFFSLPVVARAAQAREAV